MSHDNDNSTIKVKVTEFLLGLSTGEKLSLLGLSIAAIAAVAYASFSIGRFSLDSEVASAKAQKERGILEKERDISSLQQDNERLLTERGNLQQRLTRELPDARQKERFVSLYLNYMLAKERLLESLFRHGVRVGRFSHAVEAYSKPFDSSWDGRNRRSGVDFGENS